MRSMILLQKTILGLALIACSSGPVLAEITLKWAGCGITKKAFMTELAAAYEAKTGVKIDIQGGGATRGIRDTAAMDTDVDMGGTCRPMMAKEDNHITKAIPVAWDVLVVIAHKDNPVDGIGLDDLRALYRGEITSWNQLGGPDRPLKLFVREGKVSGVGYMLRRRVFYDPTMEFPSDHVFKSSGPLEKALEQDVDAIAVTGLSSAQRRDVKLLKLEGKEPSLENIKNANYMLYRPLYLVLNLKKPQAAEAQQFLDFALSHEGKQVIRDNNILPYDEGRHLVMKMFGQNKEIYEAYKGSDSRDVATQ